MVHIIRFEVTLQMKNTFENILENKPMPLSLSSSSSLFPCRVFKSTKQCSVGMNVNVLFVRKFLYTDKNLR